ncbi:MAG: paraquat-inducible protein A, partial [Verrucomicrobiota bacterium]
MKLNFRDNRVSAFFCLAGLLALVPSFFIPALLVSDAADGSRWFSIWSGIKLLYEEGNIFLSILIFVFSMVFPMLKLGIVLICCIGAHRFDPKVSQTLVRISGYTAKYSLLDVVVIALVVVLVKVDGYVRMLPTLGIYLFAAAVVASVLAELTFSKDPSNW